MPWYPHPSEHYSLGFWDGQQWLIAQTDHHLMIDGRCIALDDVAEVSYCCSKIYASRFRGFGGYDFPRPADTSKIGIPHVDPGLRIGPPRSGPGLRIGQSRILRWLSIADIHGNSVTWNLGADSLSDVAERREAWEGLVDISRRWIEPRIAHRILASLRAGEQCEIKDGWTFITLSNSGFRGRALRERSWSWSDYESAAVNPYMNNISPREFNGQVRVWANSARKNGKTRMVTGLWTSVPNAVVLGTLMPMCAAEFGGRPVVNPS